MPFTETGIPDLLIYEPRIFADSRGYFFESYNAGTFEQEGLRFPFVQDNQARSSYGVLRGLHFQLEPYAQTKLVRALEGRIMDVAVDIRKGSPTYGKVFTIELSAENKLQLLVPKGFAHGYAVLSETAEVMYKCDNFYHKASEGGIIYNDPALNIDWGIDLKDAVVSEKDMVLPTLEDCHHNFIYNS
ncbi:dTDP-4-dehydrorhamnose 3,5-epimerase [Chitinophaga japonensis]|uniref:dTDP-4-dehydrorhamnose 3,5-epimerase n=1 Tax=Chitinophaga japonensis TaxID=104662 RepID=A0A562T4M0_CHIJA|nr:dTDP-4-dehydrorhamnose 3,5-epimerase [Chitinophaga japonensis]TWI88006.1 dTDP-4-dehydrorhamnose 3,5-epimerase [Chitinophaga japonensis]